MCYSTLDTKSNKHRLFSNHTPVTPSTWEQQNKCTRVTQPATPPSQRIQDILDHDHDNNPAPVIDIPPPQRLFQTEIASNQNPIADVFDEPEPVFNHADEMDIDANPHPRSPHHSPA